MTKKAPKKKFVTLSLPQEELERKLSAHASDIWYDNEDLWEWFDVQLLKSFKRVVRSGYIDDVLDNAVKRGTAFKDIVDQALFEDEGIKKELSGYIKKRLAAKK